jgi:UDP-N-acetylglucosamine 2-epimerase
MGKDDPELIAENFISVINHISDYKFIITGANADPMGDRINNSLNNYCEKNPDKSCFVNSLGKKRFMTALSMASMAAGNSSSGIIEAPFFKIPVLNIGNRQDGRVKPDSVIDCRSDIDSIKNAFEKGLSKEFCENLKNIENPYYKYGTSNLIIDGIKSFFERKGYFKKFFDLGLED